MSIDDASSKMESFSEPEWQELQHSLKGLPDPQRRAVQGLLGLCIGDTAGWNYEFNDKSRNAVAHMFNGWHRGELPAGVRTSAQRATVAYSRRKLAEHQGTPFGRVFSDDTMCTDLKMEAVVVADEFAAVTGGRQPGAEILNQCLLQQYLTWAHIAEGKLFQGYGGFTRDLLYPRRKISLYGNNFRPTADFIEHAKGHFAGTSKGSFPSWGNGAVMSFMPQTILSLSSSPLASCATVLASTHQEPTAVLAGELLQDLLLQLIKGEVGNSDALRQACLCSETWKRVKELARTQRGYLHPVEAFEEFLQTGDCSSDAASAYLLQLSPNCGKPTGEHCFGHFGELLRIASALDSVVHGSQEPIKFSQRALNSVIIGLWCSAGATSFWEVVERLIYVGGDCDTVGAVAGQLFGPMLAPADICDAFEYFVGLMDEPEVVLAKQADGHDAVVLRDSPGGSKIHLVPNGEELVLLGRVDEHVKVRWGSLEGYAKAANVVVVESAGSCALKELGGKCERMALQVDGFSHVILKSEPHGNFLVQVPNGTMLPVLEDYGDHSKVWWEGYEGYAKATNLVDIRRQHKSGLQWISLEEQICSASARRFFHRAMLFGSGCWKKMKLTKSLANPVYGGLTDESGMKLRT